MLACCTEPTADVLKPEEDDQSVLPDGASIGPFTTEMVMTSKRDIIKLKADVACYKSLHERAIKREEELKKIIETHEATIRDLKQRLFGTKSEKSVTKSEKQSDVGEKKAGVRGQQKGSMGHGRTARPNLPVLESTVDVSDDQKSCRQCGLPYHELVITRDNDTIEVEVKAYIRRVKRKCYGASCQCNDRPDIIAAPLEPRIIPKGELGISVWVELLLGKYLFCNPLNRQLKELRNLGLNLSSGTVIDGFKKLMPLFMPLMIALKEKQQTEPYFHADETLWRIFETIAGKIGTRWYLWLFHSPSVLYYVLDKSRSADVPITHFTDMLEDIIVVCDRYSSYKKMARTLGILLAYCWAHVRRDFLELSRGYPDMEPWATQWVERIGTLYHLNNLRMEATAKRLQWTACHADLTAHIEKMKQARDEGLADAGLHSAAKKCLESLENHWDGLTVFVTQSHIPMDNNAAERGLRTPVNGRKNYYGSGAEWAGNFAAMMFSILMTLNHCWKINPRRWLTEYLEACAQNGSSAPADLSPFLPWFMTEEQLSQMRQPLSFSSVQPPTLPTASPLPLLPSTPNTS